MDNLENELAKKFETAHRIISQNNEKVINLMEDKFREACQLWGVNTEDHAELKIRCTVEQFEGQKIKAFKIDNLLVFYFTNPEVDPIDFCSEDFNVSTSISFKMSEILKPEHYGARI